MWMYLSTTPERITLCVIAKNEVMLFTRYNAKMKAIERFTTPESIYRLCSRPEKGYLTPGLVM